MKNKWFALYNNNRNLYLATFKIFNYRHMQVMAVGPMTQVETKNNISQIEVIVKHKLLKRTRTR